VGADIITNKGRARVLAQEILAGQVLVETEDMRRIVIDAADVLTVLKRERKPREQQTQAPVDEHLDEILPPELAQLEDTALRPNVIIEEPPQSDSPHANGNGDATP
jgi:hypothetical protein